LASARIGHEKINHKKKKGRTGLGREEKRAIRFPCMAGERGKSKVGGVGGEQKFGQEKAWGGNGKGAWGP